ncbi:MAG: flagellar filament capping protein FliD [Fimbriimonadaceae bacterium]|nr:flagellar filament capping protein FliD [Fimbriimonadaceae bacterium]QYK55611.1 MAG: flagellar filament capping protein FliD [Fimbriimonadaceae bacterium]
MSQLMQIEALPLNRLQLRKSALQRKSEIYGQIRTRISALSTAAASLKQASSFNGVAAKSSDTSVATITGTSGVTAGVYELSVSKIARAEKISSAPQASHTAALGYEGTAVINGKSFQIGASDSISSIASRINELNIGVTASVLNGGAGNAYLTLTSSTTGTTNGIQLADLSGSVFETLGIISGTKSFRETVGPDTVRSFGLSNGATVLSSLIGVSSTGSFTVDGQQVDIDFGVDSLTTVAAKINALETDTTATVVKTTKGGKEVYSLELKGSSAFPVLVDTDGLLNALGVFQAGKQNTVTNAQDAVFSIDGIQQTSSTNTISDLIPGATLQLLKGDETTPLTTTLTLERDTSGAVKNIESLVAAFNGVMDFISSNSSFDKDTFASGPLFGDPIASQVVAALQGLAFQDVTGPEYKNLTQIGITLGTDGKLSVDKNKLQEAFTANPAAVQKLFAASGSSTNTELSYVSSTLSTKSSGSLGYSIDITQLATKATMAGTTVQTDPSVSEILTFSGSGFSNTEVTLNVPSGGTAANLVDLINNDAKLNQVVAASLDGEGKLLLTSKRWGTPGDFTVKSNLEASTDNSGIGLEGGDYTNALNVAGTINGEPATGLGQFLAGNKGNSKTDGLQISYTGNTLGFIGSMVFSQGLGSFADSTANLFNASDSGILTASTNSFQTQMTELDTQIESFNLLLKSRQETLRKRFLAMEQAISQLQQQQQRLSQITATR